MIRYIEGEVMDVGLEGVIVKANAIGYLVAPVGCNPLNGSRVEFWIHDLVREDRRELYGFQGRDVMEVFEKLIDVPGIGHKMAQKILNAFKPDEITQKIVEGDVHFLTSLPGVGKKTAQKIVLELKGVLALDDESKTETGDKDVIDALVSLGYPSKEAAAMAADLDGDTMEEKIKNALRMAGGSK